MKNVNNMPTDGNNSSESGMIRKVLTWIVTKFSTSPTWSKIVITILVIAASLLLCFSCSAIRISQTSTGEIKVSSSQSTLDSTKIEINLLNNKK